MERREVCVWGGGGGERLYKEREWGTLTCRPNRKRTYGN